MIKKYIVLVVGLTLGLCAPVSAMESAGAARVADAGAAAVDDAAASSALFSAIKEDKFDTALALITANPFLLIEKGQWQRTPLHAAVMDKRSALVQMMIAVAQAKLPKSVYKNAFLNTGDEDGRTALHLAVRKTYWDVVKVLLAAGIDETIRDAHENVAEAYAPSGQYPVFEKSVVGAAGIASSGPLHPRHTRALDLIQKLKTCKDIPMDELQRVRDVIKTAQRYIEEKYYERYNYLEFEEGFSSEWLRSTLRSLGFSSFGEQQTGFQDYNWWLYL